MVNPTLLFAITIAAFSKRPRKTAFEAAEILYRSNVFCIGKFDEFLAQ